MAGTRWATRRRATVEVVLAGLAAVLAGLTALSRDWLEVFGWDPDRGSGLLEWLVVATLALGAVVLGLAARAHWAASAGGAGA